MRGTDDRRDPAMTEHFADMNQLLGGLGEAVKLPDKDGIDLMCACGLLKFRELLRFTIVPRLSQL
jgi:hypothetical protein